MEVFHGLEQSSLLSAAEGATQPGVPSWLHLADEAAPRIGEGDEHEASVAVVVGPLDDATVNESPYDAGRVRERDVEFLGEARHRHPVVHLEEREDLEADDREAMRLAARRPPMPVMGEERGEGLDDLGRAIARRRRRRRGDRGLQDPGGHLGNHYVLHNYSVKRNGWR